jgi:anti-anti-sigma factor
MVDHLAEPANPTVSAHRHGFAVQESWSDRLVVLSVCDEVDMLSAPQLTEAICEALSNAPTGLIVDLTEVNFLASVGMSVLVATQEAADAMSVPFGIVAEGAATSRPIRLLGIDAILVLYPTLGDALRDFRCGNDEPAPTQSP